MKNKLKLKKLLLLAAMLLFYCASGVAEDFSAEMISKTREGSFEGKIFFTKEKIRMENSQVSTITRLDKNIIWMIVPGDSKYMEMPLPVNDNNLAIGKDKIGGEIERQLMGEENIDGQITEKYRIVYESNNKRQALFTWIIKGLDIPVKTVAEDGTWLVEYRNIKIGRQPDSLFEVPPGYQKVSYNNPALPGMGDNIDLQSLGSIQF